MYKNEVSFGVILISGSETLCYKIIKTGHHVEIKLLDDKKIKLQNRQRKGGQSAQRIGRIRQEKEDAYILKSAEMAKRVFLINNNTECIVKGLVIAGPAEMKNKIISNELFLKFFKDKIIKVISTPNINTSTIWKVYEECIEDFATSEDKNAIMLLKKINTMISLTDNRLTFGENETISFLKSCSLEYILMDSNLPKQMKEQFKNLNTYGCKIYELDKSKITSMIVDIIGIKWF